MLIHTFIHLPGVTAALEQQLWKAGILTWTDFLASKEHERPVAVKNLDTHVSTGMERLNDKDLQYFTGLLDPKEHWRLMGHFQDRLLLVDIETTGFRLGADPIVAIATLDNQRRVLENFVQGVNLDMFATTPRPHSILVTFNGEVFDIPRLKHRFPDFKFPWTHVDLRRLFSNVGIKGGLKGIEEQLGSLRPAAIAGVDGKVSVTLWQLYQSSRDKRYLEALLAYNSEDVLQLAALLPTAYALNVRQLSPALTNIAPPAVARPANPHPVDAAAVHAAVAAAQDLFPAKTAAAPKKRVVKGL